jgi:hypothetical protein
LDYATAADVLAAIDALDADVAARLDTVARGAGAAAAAFQASAERDRARRRRERAGLAERLRIGPGAAPAPAAVSGTGLRALRDAQQALVHAHAEGLPALRDRASVDLLARHMVDLAAQLTVLDLWIEADEGDA